MSRAQIRHLFPGGNTSLGFFSYYGSVLPQEEAEHIFLLKGGPGVGKSTFLRRIGETMAENGFDVEYLHCSSDNDSLDGVHIPAIKTALLDGTSPHIVDPKNPGAVDEILNFGEFWNEAGIRAHKSEVLRLNAEISHVFSRAYRYLQAAAAIRGANADLYARAADSARINRFTAGLLSELFDGGAGVSHDGRERALFASAVTPDGYRNYLDSVLTAGRVYELRGEPGTGEHRILEKVKAAALERGYDVEAFYCALDPFRLEHLVIPGLDTAITTSNDYHSSTVRMYSSTDMGDFMRAEVLAPCRADIEQNTGEFDRLMSVALQTLRRAKALHDELEAIYVPNVRFSEIDELLQKTLRRLLP